MKNEIIKLMDHLEKLQEEKYKVSRELKGMNNELGGWNLGLSHGYMDAAKKLSELLIKNKENGLIEMKYYEFKKPYYVIVKAPNKSVACDHYFEHVSKKLPVSDLLNNVEEVAEYYVAFTKGVWAQGGTNDLKDYKEIFEKDVTTVIR